MNALIINCSPVKTGTTQEIVNIVSTELESRHEVKNKNNFEFIDKNLR